MQDNRRIMVSALFVVAFCLFAQEAFANVALPLVFVTVPGMLVALVPVVMLEAYILKIILRINHGSALPVAIGANVLTTLVGLPLMWVGALIVNIISSKYGGYIVASPLGMVTGISTWFIILAPPTGEKNLWVIPAQLSCVLVPTFFMSWWLEYLFAAKKLKDISRKKVKYAVMWANLASYGALEVVFLSWLAYLLLSAPDWMTLGGLPY